MKMFWRFLTGESGVAAVEDCLIAAGIVLAIIAIVNGLGAKVYTKFTSVDTSQNNRFRVSRRRTVSP